jgi:hypothetical protein
VLIVEVVRAVLHENSNRLPRRLPYHRRVIVPALAKRPARLDIGEAADTRKYFAEFGRPFPSGRET